jgi:hypothetical protein
MLTSVDNMDRDVDTRSGKGMTCLPNNYSPALVASILMRAPSDPVGRLRRSAAAQTHRPPAQPTVVLTHDLGRAQQIEYCATALFPTSPERMK